MANFILLGSLKPVQREIVVAELKHQAAMIRYAKRTGQINLYEKYQDQSYGYSHALAQILAISWFTVNDEIQEIWNFAKYATRVSEPEKWPVHQSHYANGTVAFMVMANIKAETPNED